MKFPFYLSPKKHISKTQNYLPGYRPDIDGLRAIAILAVVIFHSFPSLLPGGFIGVDIFFVISGYLISNIIYTSLSLNNFSVVEFYAHRVKRIFPALIIVLTVTLIFAWYMLFIDEFRLLGKHVVWSVIFSENILLSNEVGYFDKASDLKPLLHLWSLGVEEQFYLLLPALLWVHWRLGRPSLPTFILIAVVSFSLNLYGSYHDPARTFFNIQTRLWELMAGCILTKFTLLYRSGSFELPKFQAAGFFHGFNFPDQAFLKDLASATGLVLLIAPLFIINEGMIFPGVWALLPVTGAVLVLLAGTQAWGNRNILAHRFMVWVGLISYPLYLWHWPLLSFARIINSDTPPPLTRIWAVILSFAFAFLTYKFIERPIRFGQRTWIKTASLCILTLSLGAVGYLIDRDQLHPRSIRFDDVQDFVRASKDWEYPKNLDLVIFNSQKTYRTGGSGKKTLFFGDSNIEQYAPRIVSLLKSNETQNRGAIFYTGGGCPPVPFVHEKDHPWCEGFTENFIKLANEEDIDTIVIGAQWFGYFPHPIFHYKTDNGNWALESNEGMTEVRKNLLSMIKSVSRPGRSIYIVLNIPVDPKIDPIALVKRDFLNELFVIRNVSINKSDFVMKHEKVQSMLFDIANQTNTHIVNPMDYLCRNDICPSIGSDGKSIYKDGYHLRASFVRRSISYLDQTVLR